MSEGASRTFLAGADVVLADRVVSGVTVVVEGDRIADLVSGPREIDPREARVDLTGALVLPGFIDVHVHGALGVDTLDGAGSIEALSRSLPRFGVTAFCPTTVACAPEPLDAVLQQIGELRARTGRGPSARVLPAHLESNFLNPEYAGAQPIDCLRTYRAGAPAPGAAFTADAILDVITRRRADIGIVTLAPEIDGGMELVRALTTLGIRVAVGHSGATYEQAQAAIAAGVRHATHLFNRMRPMTHRDPGLAAAVLAGEDIAAELICDGRHVHPAMMQVAIAAKSPARMMAITDATAGAGLPRGARAKLGGRDIVVSDVATLADGTLAGSVLTMDRAFACLAGPAGLDVVAAARMCSTTPARELGLLGFGVITPGAVADFTVLDSGYRPLATWVGGREVWSRGTSGPRTAS